MNIFKDIIFWLSLGLVAATLLFLFTDLAEAGEVDYTICQRHQTVLLTDVNDQKDLTKVTFDIQSKDTNTVCEDTSIPTGN